MNSEEISGKIIDTFKIHNKRGILASWKPLSIKSVKM